MKGQLKQFEVESTSGSRLYSLRQNVFIGYVFWDSLLNFMDKIHKKVFTMETKAASVLSYRIRCISAISV